MILSILSVGIITTIFLIMAFIAYANGNKKEAIMLRNGVYSFLASYIMLVIVIGCAPIK